MEGQHDGSEYGFNFSANTNPILNDSVRKVGIADGLKNFSTTIMAMAPGNYSYCSYLKGKAKTQYGTTKLLNVATAVYIAPFPNQFSSDSASISLWISTNITLNISNTNPWATIQPATILPGYKQKVKLIIQNNTLQTNRITTITFSGITYNSTDSIKQLPLIILPSINTSPASSISYASATSGGNITSDGGASIIARGVCWGTSQNPTIANSKTSDGTGTGNYISNISGLTVNTTYYIRAYATNSAGTGYGEQVTFTTLTTTTPTLSTNTVSSITQTTASCGGNIDSDNGASVTARGVCWGTGQNPTTSNSKTSNGTGIGSFTSSITGLTANTTYYVRAYATNSAGISYGAQDFFTTLAPSVPTLITSAVISISQTSASCGGNISSDNGASITVRGVCWGTVQNPTILNSKTSNGSGTGSFTTSISGLTANTTYYVRAYATNSAGTAYGSLQTFKTLAVPPTIPIVSTSTISSITQTTASCGGSISSDGGASVTKKGVCWGVSQNPTTSNNLTSDGAGTGDFSSSISGLTANTTYYVRAYATNSVGIAYGTQQSFTTAATIPAITTAAISAITTSTATGGGTIISNGGATITVSGICWSTSANPTISDNFTTDGSVSSDFTSNITGLAPNTTYYVVAYATNSSGTAYGSQQSFTTTALAIGSSYQGGIIAYILKAGDPGYVAGETHGLIAAPSDQSTGIKWWNGSFVTIGATGTALGKGMANTIAIIAAQGAGSYAANLCKNLTLNGYHDWYLPSLDELNKLYINNYIIGGFSNTGFYWSSSEYDADNVWIQTFYNTGIQANDSKYSQYKVRAIRSF